MRGIETWRLVRIDSGVSRARTRDTRETTTPRPKTSPRQIDNSAKARQAEVNRSRYLDEARWSSLEPLESDSTFTVRLRHPWIFMKRFDIPLRSVCAARARTSLFYSLFLMNGCACITRLGFDKVECAWMPGVGVLLDLFSLRSLTVFLVVSLDFGLEIDFSFFFCFLEGFGRFSKFSNAVSFDSFNGDMIKYVQVVHV